MEFVDAVPIKALVTNLWPFNIELSANGYLESESGVKEPVIIPANEKSEAIIYTKYPRFSFNTTEYPINADYRIEDNIMYVTLK